MEAKYEDNLLSLVKIDSDKTLFQEIMKSTLLLQQYAHSGKGEWEAKSPAVISNIKRLEEMLASKQTDERYRLSWIDSEEEQSRLFNTDISRNEAEIKRLSDLVNEIRDWLQDRDSLIKDSNDRLEKLYRKGDNLKNAHEKDAKTLADQAQALTGELESMNSRVRDAEKLAGDKKDAVKHLINNLNDRINKCKGLEGKIKQTIDEYDRMNSKLNKDKQGIRDLLERLTAVLGDLSSL